MGDDAFLDHGGTVFMQKGSRGSRSSYPRWRSPAPPDRDAHPRQDRRQPPSDHRPPISVATLDGTLWPHYLSAPPRGSPYVAAIELCRLPPVSASRRTNAQDRGHFPLFALPTSTIAHLTGDPGPTALPQRTLLRHLTWSLSPGQWIANHTWKNRSCTAGISRTWPDTDCHYTPPPRYSSTSCGKPSIKAALRPATAPLTGASRHRWRRGGRADPPHPAAARRRWAPSR